MTEWNNTDVRSFKDIWVFCEQRQREMMSTTYELISEGRKLADNLGVRLCGVLLGNHVEEIAVNAAGYGLDQMYLCESELLDEYTTDAYTKVICDLVQEYKPEILLFGATNIGRDLAPRCAARLHTGLCADCTHLDVDVQTYLEYLQENSSLDVNSLKLDPEDHNLKMTRPAFGGHLMATIICPRFRPVMATVRPGVMKRAVYDPSRESAMSIVRPDFELTDADIRTRVVNVVKTTDKLVNLTDAEYIVAVGRGISKDVKKGIELAEKLADVLGGTVGASRPCVDDGWLSHDRQVGQTGKTVRPKVYIALGISGAIQHRAGMQDSEYIIAVNKNADAPIFEVADCGLCGDLFTIVPMLTEAFEEVIASK